MLCRYQEAFSLRDVIGACPYIEVEIDGADTIFLRPYHLMEEDKHILDKEMKRLCHLGILKSFFPSILQSNDVDR